MINLETVKKLRGRKWTLKRIGDRYGVTSERIRQILNKKKSKYCEKHKVQFVTKCKHCFQEANYKKVVKGTIKKHNLEKEIARLSKKDRRGEIVVQRKLLIKKLHDELHMSFNEISRLLKRHHTTIAWLYST
jgi:hypothetical protein